MEEAESTVTFRVRDSTEQCVICLDNISEPATLLPCNHDLFDGLCILTWLLGHASKCPLCKTQVTAVIYDIVSADSYQIFYIPGNPTPTSSPRHGLSSIESCPARERRRRRRSPSPDPRHDVALEQRKHVYKHQLYSLHIGTNAISRHRDITPAIFSSSPDLQARARKWLRRELRVFAFLDPSRDESVHDVQATKRKRQANNAEFLLEYIIAMLKKLEIKDANGKAEQILAEFLGRQNARLLLHELEAWLRSPYVNMKEWDAIAQYPAVT